jgi:hypothetical protein
MISNSKSFPEFGLGEASDSFSNTARDGAATCLSLLVDPLVGNRLPLQVLGVRPEQTRSETEVTCSPP